ncbi:unnamed protein product [Staurois parvus]|uniref:Uncharacterized protein n=1 Tax=Staurois parvus TaxID=386267 RepID=A0ABN9FSS6_9NEOB|nr:unnamed protein product [Staurois parvus]
MGQMASMFFNKVGVNLFYLCIIVYLYGDLAIYATAVPLSLVQVTCFSGNETCGSGTTEMNDTQACWGKINRINAYRIYLAVFTLLLGPFTFFNVQKTKYLQILTSLMRWLGDLPQHPQLFAVHLPLKDVFYMDRTRPEKVFVQSK